MKPIRMKTSVLLTRVKGSATMISSHQLNSGIFPLLLAGFSNTLILLTKTRILYRWLELVTPPRQYRMRVFVLNTLLKESPVMDIVEGVIATTYQFVKGDLASIDQFELVDTETGRVASFQWREV